MWMGSKRNVFSFFFLKRGCQNKWDKFLIHIKHLTLITPYKYYSNLSTLRLLPFGPKKVQNFTLKSNNECCINLMLIRLVQLINRDQIYHDQVKP